MGKRKAPPESDDQVDRDGSKAKTMDATREDDMKKMDFETLYSSDFSFLSLPSEVQMKIYSRLKKDLLVTLRLVSQRMKQTMDSLFLLLPIIHSNLSDTPEFYEQQFLKYIQLNPEVTSISFRSCIVDKVLPILPKNLLYLNLTSCRRVTDDSIPYFPRGLRILNLSNCTEITSEGLKHLPDNLVRLKLGNCVEITDEGIKHLPASLLHLNLFGCSKITDNAIAFLPPYLETLNVIGCTKLSQSAIKAISPTCKVHV